MLNFKILRVILALIALAIPFNVNATAYNQGFQAGVSHQLALTEPMVDVMVQTEKLAHTDFSESAAGETEVALSHYKSLSDRDLLNPTGEDDEAAKTENAKIRAYQRSEVGWRF